MHDWRLFVLLSLLTSIISSPVSRAEAAAEGQPVGEHAASSQENLSREVVPDVVSSVIGSDGTQGGASSIATVSKDDATLSRAADGVDELHQSAPVADSKQWSRSDGSGGDGDSGRESDDVEALKLEIKDVKLNANFEHGEGEHASSDGLVDEPIPVDASTAAELSSVRLVQQQQQQQQQHPDLTVQAVAKNSEALEQQQQQQLPTGREESEKEKSEEHRRSQQEQYARQVELERSAPATNESTADANASADVIPPAATERHESLASLESDVQSAVPPASSTESETVVDDGGSAARGSPGGLDKTQPTVQTLPTGPDVVDSITAAVNDDRRPQLSQSAADGPGTSPTIEPVATAVDRTDATQQQQHQQQSRETAGQGEAAAAAVSVASNGAFREDNDTVAAGTAVHTLSTASGDAVTEPSDGAGSIPESQGQPAQGQQQQQQPLLPLETHPHPGKVPVLSVPDEGEQLPSFDEWKEKMLAQQKQQADKFYEPSERPRKEANTRKTHKMSNYASEDCGAKVVAKNPEAGNANSVLNENMDDYLINPCSTKKWLVVELCDPVEIRQIDLGNLELFSSLPKNFSVFISPNSERYPTTKESWRLLGVFQAGEERAIHSFFMPREPGLIYTKYVKIELGSHYGHEHYCPLTVLRVYGSTVVDDYDDDDDDVPAAASLSAASGSTSVSAVPSAGVSHAADSADAASGVDVLVDDGVSSRGGGSSGGSHMLHITDTVVGIVKKVLGKSGSLSLTAGAHLQISKDDAVAASALPLPSLHGSRVTRHSGNGKLWGCLVCTAAGNQEACTRSTACDHGLRLAGWTEQCTEWANTVCCRMIGLDEGCLPSASDDVLPPRGGRSDDDVQRAPVSCHHCTDSSAAGQRSALSGRPAPNNGSADETVSRNLIDEGAAENRGHGVTGAATDVDARRAAGLGVDDSSSSSSICGNSGCVYSSESLGSASQDESLLNIRSNVAPEQPSSVISHMQTADHSTGSSGYSRTDAASSISQDRLAGSESIGYAASPANSLDSGKEIIYSSHGVVRHRPATGMPSDVPILVIPESTDISVASIPASGSDRSELFVSTSPASKVPVVSSPPSQPDANEVVHSSVAFEAHTHFAEAEQQQQQQQHRHDHVKSEVAFDGVAGADAVGGFVGEDGERPCAPESGVTVGHPSAQRPPSLSDGSDPGPIAVDISVAVDPPYLGSASATSMDVRGKEGFNLSTVTTGGQPAAPAAAVVGAEEPAIEKSADRAQINAASAAPAEHGGGGMVQLGAMPAQLPKREAAIMRLSNVIKTLEQNLTLTNRYLEEMSRKYRKQKEELQKALNATIDLLNKLSARVQVQEATHRLEMNTLRSELNELTSLARNSSTFIETLRDHGAVDVTSVLFVTLLVTLVLTCCRRRRSTLTKAEMAEMMKFMADAPPKVSALKRSSSSAGALGHVPTAGAVIRERPLIRYRSQQVLSARQRSPDIVDEEGSENVTAAAERTNVDIIYPLTWRTFNSPCPNKTITKHCGGADPASPLPDPKLKLFRMRSPPTARRCLPVAKRVQSTRRGCCCHCRRSAACHLGPQPGRSRSTRRGSWQTRRRDNKPAGYPPRFGDACTGQLGSSDDCEWEHRDLSEIEDACASTTDELGSFVEDVRTPFSATLADRHRMPSNGSACNGVPSDCAGKRAAGGSRRQQPSSNGSSISGAPSDDGADDDGGGSAMRLLDKRLLRVNCRQPTSASVHDGAAASRSSNQLLMNCAALKIKAINDLPPGASPAIGVLPPPDGALPSPQGRR